MSRTFYTRRRFGDKKNMYSHCTNYNWVVIRLLVPVHYPDRKKNTNYIVFIDCLHTLLYTFTIGCYVHKKKYTFSRLYKIMDYEESLVKKLKSKDAIITLNIRVLTNFKYFLSQTKTTIVLTVFRIMLKSMHVFSISVFFDRNE